MNSICRDCKGQCCHTMLFEIAGLPDIEVEWLKARGVTQNKCVSVPARCKQLTEDGLCGIYDERPQGCREFGVMSPACLLARHAFAVLRKDVSDANP